MPHLRKIRLIAAFTLLCAMFLPLSQCSRQTDAQAQQPPPPPAAKSIPEQLFPHDNDQFDYEYAIGDLDLTWKSALTLLAFTWPALFILVGWKLSKSRFPWISPLLELLLCGGTIYWLCHLTLFGEWLYGAYVALISIVVFGCSALVSLFHVIRAILARRRSPAMQSG